MRVTPLTSCCGTCCRVGVIWRRRQLNHRLLLVQKVDKLILQRLYIVICSARLICIACIRGELFKITIAIQYFSEMTFNATVVLTERYPALFRRMFRGKTSQFAAYIAFLSRLSFPKLPIDDVRERRRHDHRIRAGAAVGTGS